MNESLSRVTRREQTHRIELDTHVGLIFIGNYPTDIAQCIVHEVRDAIANGASQNVRSIIVEPTLDNTL